MKFELTIGCDTAAFEPEIEGAASFEVARILANLAEVLRETDTLHGVFGLLDANGNVVGNARFTHDDEVDDREFLQPDHDEEEYG